MSDQGGTTGEAVENPLPAGLRRALRTTIAAAAEHPDDPQVVTDEAHMTAWIAYIERSGPGGQVGHNPLPEGLRRALRTTIAAAAEHPDDPQTPVDEDLMAAWVAYIDPPAERAGRRDEDEEWKSLVNDEWLSARQAAEVLGISTRGLTELVGEGLLRAYRPHRRVQYRRSDVLAYLRTRQVRPGDLDPSG